MQIIDYKKLMEQKPSELGSTANSKGQHIKFYEDPIYGEDAFVIGVINNVAFETGFYDLGDFGILSDYNPVLQSDGSVVCELEQE